MGCSASISKERDCGFEPAKPPLDSKDPEKNELILSVADQKVTSNDSQGTVSTSDAPLVWAAHLEHVATDPECRVQDGGSGLDVTVSGDFSDSFGAGSSNDVTGVETPPGCVWHTVDELTPIPDTPAGGATHSVAIGNAEDEQQSQRPTDKDLGDAELTFAGGGTVEELSEVLSHRQCHLLKILLLPGRYGPTFFEEAGDAINGLKSLEKLVCGSFGLKSVSGFPLLSCKFLIHIEIINISFGLKVLLSILRNSQQTLRHLLIVSCDEMRHESTYNVDTLLEVIASIPVDIECLTLTKSLELSDLMLKSFEDRCLNENSLKVANFSRSVCDPISVSNGCSASRTALCRSNDVRPQPSLNEILTFAAWSSLKARYPKTAFSIDYEALEFDDRQNMFVADAAHRPLKEAEFSGPKKESCIF